MAEETTVERVTRRSARYQPQATELKQEIFELQNALQNTRYYAVEEINKYKAHFEVSARAPTKRRHVKQVLLKSLKPSLLLLPSYIMLKGT